MTASRALLRKPWDTLPTQRYAAKLGIWIFLASEALFFGALFLGLMMTRAEHGAAVLEAARQTNVWYGTANTFVLLTSSLTMAVAAKAGEQVEGARGTVLWCLAGTALLGVVFLIIKGFEYDEDIREHLVPGSSFKLAAPAAQIFFAFYWLMTAVHAVHLSIGIGLVSRLWWLGFRARVVLHENPQLEVTALYWHLVDVIWIFIYPVIYLAGRAG